MTRTVPEWQGKTADTPIPPRVRLRVFQRDQGRCQGCTRTIRPQDGSETDHIVALVNGGANAESNLQTLCKWCHAEKTGTDVAEKADVARKAKKHQGFKARKGRPMMGTKASGWKRKMNGEAVRR